MPAVTNKEIARGTPVDEDKLKEEIYNQVRRETYGLETLLTTWQLGPDVIIQDEKEGTGRYDFPGLEFALRGVFVKRRGKDGSVRITGKGEVEIVVSGPRERDEYVIIPVRPGQNCGILGWPTYRLITSQGEAK
jgi:hypothetical protein